MLDSFYNFDYSTAINGDFCTQGEINNYESFDIDCSVGPYYQNTNIIKDKINKTHD